MVFKGVSPHPSLAYARSEKAIAGVVAIAPPASHRSGPIFLNVLRVCDIPEALGLLAPRSLTLVNVAWFSRYMRSAAIDTLAQDYVRLARAKGLPERVVVIRHALRASLTPIITIFGLDLGLLLDGAILTETTFSLPGLGQFTLLAIQNQDFPEIMGVVLLAAFFIVIATMVVDILYAVIDPRVRL